MLTRLEYKQILPIKLEDAWDFFSSPNNLAKITPKEMAFIVTSKTPKKIYPGLIISYIVKPLFGIPMKWVTEITHSIDNEFFVDEQRFGPYKFWHHQHHFRAIEEGTEMVDIINFVVPFGFLGAILSKLFIRKKVESIFIYREKVLKEIFG